MSRVLTCLALLAALCVVSVCAQAQTVTVNGKTVAATAVEKAGTTYVEAVPFVRALGGDVSWDAATKKLTIIVAATRVVVTPQTIDGKSFVGVTEVTKALGGTVAYDAKAKVLNVTLAAQPAGVKGTTQLAGDNALLGQTFTLDEGSPVNFTLRGLEYSVAGLRLGDVTAYPKAGEKLLVLHFTLQNPNPADLYIRWTTLHFTAVDADNLNHEYLDYLAEEQTKAKVDMSLKPGQKIECYAAILVPAGKAIPKLMVLPPAGKVLRYDLTLPANAVKGLAAPYADPADPTGAIARTEVPVVMGTPFIAGEFLFTLTSAEYSIAGLRFDSTICYPKQDEKTLVLRGTVTNPNPDERNFSWSTLRFTGMDSGNVSYDGVDYVGIGQNHATDGLLLQPGQSVEIYTGMKLPADKAITQLKVQSDNYRTLCYAAADAANAIKGLDALYADPQDAAGATALTEVPAKLNTAYITGSLQVTLANAVYSTANFGEETAPEGGSFLILTYTMKNLDNDEQEVNWDILTPELMLDDDSTAEWNSKIFTAKNTREFTGNMKPGQEATFRQIFAIPAETKAKTLTVRESDEDSGGRTLRFDLSTLAAAK